MHIGIFGSNVSKRIRIFGCVVREATKKGKNDWNKIN